MENGPFVFHQRRMLLRSIKTVMLLILHIVTPPIGTPPIGTPPIVTPPTATPPALIGAGSALPWGERLAGGAATGGCWPVYTPPTHTQGRSRRGSMRSRRGRAVVTIWTSALTTMTG